MSDARIPERWLLDRRVNSLTDGAFRSFVNSLTWSVAQRTDGVVARSDFALIPRFSEKHVDELVAVGLWAPVADGWLIVDYGTSQTTRAEFLVLENNRRRDREKKARQRSAKTSSVPSDFPGDVSPGTGQAGRTGRDHEVTWETRKPGSLDETTGEVRDFDPDEPF